MDGYEFKYYSPDTKTSLTQRMCKELEGKESPAVSLILFNNWINAFILANDGILYQDIRALSPMKSNVSGISYGHDGKSIIITSIDGYNGRKKVSSFNIKEHREALIYTEPEAEVTKFSSKEKVSGNGLEYTVKNKKIGYSIAD